MLLQAVKTHSSARVFPLQHKYFKSTFTTSYKTNINLKTCISMYRLQFDLNYYNKILIYHQNFAQLHLSEGG